MATDKLLWMPVENAVVDRSWAASANRAPDNTLGKDAFLQLLITQMKFQDPLNPMDDRDFLGQMAQFTALEQMQNLNTAFSKSQAYGMIGKTVDAMYRNPVSGEWEEIYGYVDAVTVKNGEVFLIVEGKEIPLSSVNVVGDDYLTALQLNDILEHVSSTRGQSYVGQYIQAVLKNDQGEETEYVEGLVDYVKTVKGQAVLVVGNKEVLLSEVASVAANPGGTANHPFLLGKPIQVGNEMRIINGVNINAGRASLTFVGGSSVGINTVNHVMDAFHYVNREITTGSVSGKVLSLGISGTGVPYFNVETENGVRTVDYMEFLDFQAR
jgi:flagellar basal-body rod modification protein FlgD